jgi:hypothetical protein
MVRSMNAASCAASKGQPMGKARHVAYEYAPRGGFVSTEPLEEPSCAWLTPTFRSCRGRAGGQRYIDGRADSKVVA